MSPICLPVSRIANAVQQVYHAIKEKDPINLPWAAVNEDNLWRELVACILGSRVRYEITQAAVARMDKANLFSAIHRSTQYAKYEQDIFNVLSVGKKTFKSGYGRGCYPFAKLRANQISQAAKKLYSDNGSIHGLLYDMQGPQMARRHLAAEVPGLGPKQASLFLRNIGYAEDIAVLDVHVLTYMNWIGLTPVPIKSVPTIRRYETLERILIEYSSINGFQAENFDIAVWVVVRTAKKECQTWR